MRFFLIYRIVGLKDKFKVDVFILARIFVKQPLKILIDIAELKTVVPQTE